ncbi:MAG: DUF108 domain-containing protein [Candidatus Omnitrophica bacterium]|nr:DUF108 domain-containing protein [Candidatus Omnitrophota bacterium]
MSKQIEIGIVGCGAIGSSLAEALIRKFNREANLSGVFDIKIERAFELADRLNNKKLVVLTLEDLILRSQLIIEATTSSASYDIAFKSISYGKNVMIMSVGGILERFFELRELAEEKNAKIIIPSGAICGIDALKALSSVNIEKVVLTTRKSPSAFKGNLYLIEKNMDLDGIKEDTLLFRGNVFDAVKNFPQNINICALISIAIGNTDKIEVNIIASPKLDSNLHELQVYSGVAKIFVQCENIVHPSNPKTSYLAVLSAETALREFLECVKIGT